MPSIPEYGYWGFYLIFTQLLAVAGLLFLLLYLFLRGHRSQVQLTYASSTVSLLIWLVSMILLTHNQNNLSLWLLIHLHFFSITAFALSFVLFGAAYHGQQKLSLKLMIPVALPVLLTFLVILSNPLHHLFLTGLSSSGIDAGPFYYFVTGLNLLYILTGLWLCGRTISQRLSSRRLLVLFFNLAILLLSLVFSIFFVSQTILRMLSPIVLALMVILIGIIALHYHIFDVIPLARRLIMNEISSALAVTRPDNKIIDANLAMIRLFNPNAEFRLLMPIEVLSPQLRLTDDDQLPLQKEMYFETAAGRRLFELYVHSVVNAGGKLLGRIYRLVELDQDQYMRHLLSEQNKQMAMANQSLQRYLNITAELRSIVVRNQIAREMHDSLGHTLIILISMLEKYLDREQSDQASDVQIIQAIELLGKAKSQLPQQNIEPAASFADGSLQSELLNMFDQLSATGIKLESDFRGQLERVPAKHQQDLIQICREAVTNAVKHGQAKTVSLFLLADPQSYRLIILDDGQGNQHYSKGFGLKNMENRVAQLGGSMRIQSDSSGFGIHIIVPYPDANRL